ncbi:MAG: hypothetical protein PHW82_07300 [Bacteroidales bacterium]|nr:hypothetical protein [Bacteroidales bacterium]
MENKQNLSKEQQQIISDLYSSDSQIVHKTIKKLGDKGGLFIIKPLMDVYFSNPSKEVVLASFDIVRDLKESKAARIIIENILKYKTNDRLSDFISALWQSAIKFDNLEVFVEIFVKAEDTTALETVTLIQQNGYLLTDESRKKCLNILKSEIGGLSEFKKALVIDLLEIFE